MKYKGGKQAVFFLITVLFCTALARAEIYKWVDESGKVHFSDAKPSSVTAESLELTVNTYEHVSIEELLPEQLDTQTNDVNKKEKKVIMYSTQWCSVCKKAKRYFKKNKIAFTEYDIESKKKYYKKFKRLGGKGVPLIVVGNKKMSGFGVKSFKRLYK